VWEGGGKGCARCVEVHLGRCLGTQGVLARSPSHQRVCPLVLSIEPAISLHLISCWRTPAQVVETLHAADLAGVNNASARLRTGIPPGHVAHAHKPQCELPPPKGGIRLKCGRRGSGRGAYASSHFRPECGPLCVGDRAGLKILTVRLV